MGCLCNSINIDALFVVVFNREVHVKVGQAELFCTLNYHFFPAFTRSTFTKETLEQGVKYVQS